MKACDTQNMSLTSFKFVLNWLKRNNFKAVRLIGGEPSIFPEIETFIDTVISYHFFEEILIFSNFTFDHKFAEMIVEKNKQIRIDFLPNINEFDLIIPKHKENILNNLDYMFKNMPNLGQIGINVYRPDMDLTQWEDLIAKYAPQLNNLRYCIAIPTKAIVENNFDFYEYYSQFDDIMNKIVDIGEKYNIRIGVDCNNVPPCCFKDSTIARIYKSNPEMLNNGQEFYCGFPVIDCRPDLSIAGCFGFNCPEISEKTLKDFRTFEEIRAWCQQVGDTSNLIARKECLDCERWKRFGHSCSCKTTHLIDKNTLEKKMR